MRAHAWFPILLACVCVVGCNATDVGNPEPEVPSASLQFAAIVDAGKSLELDTGVTIDEAWMVLERVRYWQDNSGACTGDNRIDQNTALVVELITGREWPTPTGLAEVTGPLCRLDLDFTRYAPTDTFTVTDAPDALIGQAVYIKGTLADGRAFDIQLSLEQLIALRALQPEGFTAPMTADAGFLIVFDVGAWLNGVDFTALVTAADDAGTPKSTPIRIEDRGATNSLARIVLENVRTSARLLLDAQADGVPQEDELSAPLADSSGATAQDNEP